MTTTSFFYVNFDEEEEKFQLPATKATKGELVYSSLMNGIYINWPHKNPLNKLDSTLGDNVLLNSDTQLEIFNKFNKFLQGKILMNIRVVDYLTLEYSSVEPFRKSGDIIYLGVKKSVRRNPIFHLLKLYISSVNQKFTIRPRMNEKYFAHFFANRTQCPVPGPVVPAADQPNFVPAVVELDPLIRDLLEKGTAQVPLVMTKEDIVQEVVQEAKAAGLPLPENDLQLESPIKRRRVDSSSTVSGSTYSGDESFESELSDSDDERMSKASELNLNNHFKQSLQVAKQAKSEVSSIGSSIIRNFKSMQINTNEYSKQLAVYVNAPSEAEKASVRTLFGKFTSTMKDFTIEQVKPTVEFIVPQVKSDNTLIQRLVVKAKNGCVESIYYLFVLILFSNTI